MDPGGFEPLARGDGGVERLLGRFGPEIDLVTAAAAFVAVHSRNVHGECSAVPGLRLGNSSRHSVQSACSMVMACWA